jgi:hypothetical protein
LPPTRPVDRAPTASIPKPTAVITKQTAAIAKPAAVIAKPQAAKPAAVAVKPAAAVKPVAALKPPAAAPRPYRAYVLRDVSDGVAVVESEDGAEEVSPGDVLSGGARVQRIEKRGGGWVVMTDRGFIASDGRWED